MNSSKFVQTEGYPLTSERLQELQTTFQPFNAFGNLAGNLTIINGCEVLGSTVQNGSIFINGELLEFREAPVDGSSTVIIVEDKIYKPFKNGTTKEVYAVRYATFGTNPEASWPWSSFTRPIQTKVVDNLITQLTNRLITVESKLIAIQTKLDSIEFGAQKNVQSDWNITDVLSDAYIKNKISFDSPFLRRDRFHVGNVGTSGNVNDTKMTVTFPSVGTANYMVLGSLKGRSGFWNDDDDVFCTWGGETNSSFEIYLREIIANTQDLYFYYVLIPLP